MVHTQHQNEFLRRFNEKIDSFSEHPDYPDLRKKANEYERLWSGFGLEAIIAQDFVERIVAMPLDYIADWLDGKNELKWRREDQKMLEAIKVGYEEILKAHPDYEIHKISLKHEGFYTQEYDYEVLERRDDCLIVGKKEKAV